MKKQTIFNPFTREIEDLTWFSMSDAARLVGHDMGRTKLYNFLRKKGVIRTKSPNIEYVNLMYFKTVQKKTKRDYGPTIDVVLLVSNVGIGYLKTLLTSNLPEVTKPEQL